CGRKLHCPFFAIDMRAMALAHEPIGAAINPNIKAVRFDGLHRRLYDVGLYNALLQQGEVWLDEHSAIKRRDRRRQGQRLDQHLHSSRRTAAGDSELDTSHAHLGDGGAGPFVKHLFVGQEGSIHVSEEQFDRHLLIRNTDCGLRIQEKSKGAGGIKKTVFYFLNTTLNFFWLLL